MSKKELTLSDLQTVRGAAEPGSGFKLITGSENKDWTVKTQTETEATASQQQPAPVGG
jgi:hypothetical protein